MRDADVLRLVHDCEVERRVLAFDKSGRQSGEQTRKRGELPFLQSAADSLEDRPQHGSLRLRQAGLAPEPGHIMIRLPCFQLPGIDYLLPFGQQKMQAKLVTVHGTRASTHQLTDNFAGGDRWLSNVRFVEPKPDGVKRMNIYAFAKSRLVADQSL